MSNCVFFQLCESSTCDIIKKTIFVICFQILSFMKYFHYKGYFKNMYGIAEKFDDQKHCNSPLVL